MLCYAIQFVNSLGTYGLLFLHYYICYIKVPLQEDGGKKIELKPGFYMEHDKDVGAVVVGFDRYFNYYKVQYGTLCVRENPGCLFLATNRDAVTHLTDAQEWAGLTTPQFFL
ncbi:putative phosphoglycolate phosphatase [Helianthus anomalus]